MNSSILRISFSLSGVLVGSLGVAGPIENQLKLFLGTPEVLVHTQQIEQQGLHRGYTRKQPWSSSYWPDITGSIANPYRSRTVLGNQLKFLNGFQGSKKSLYRDFGVWSNEWASWPESKVSRELPPSAKYDVSVGNQNFEFTRNILEELEFRSQHTRVPTSSGSSIWKETGRDFPGWSGICDGWSYASLILPRPVRPVTLQTANGKSVTWYPEDIKALGSYLLARTNTPDFASMGYRFLGERCKSRRPNEQCQDLNAALWHLTLINRIGIQKTGFVMDIDNNHKINNHPVFGYEFEFFNLATGRKGSLTESKLTRGSFTDRYSGVRNPKTQWLVGVRSRVQYLNYVLSEKRSRQITDSPKQDAVKSVVYTYDLELTENGEIVGGFWGNRRKESEPIAHSDDGASSDPNEKIARQPDFVWLAPIGFKPYSRFSLQTQVGYANADGSFEWAWNGTGSLPEDWRLAIQAEQSWKKPELNSTESRLRPAQPLSNFVLLLFDLAQEK